MEVKCPNNSNHKKFEVVAHVTQAWETDEKGNYLETIVEVIEIVHEPNKDDIWTCTQCGAQAIVR